MDEEGFRVLWQKRRVPPADGPGAPVDLQTLTGLSGRLVFAEGYSGNRMANLHCTVVRVDRSEILVELANPDPVPPAETAVILEVATQSALIQCFTSVRNRGKELQLSLRTPARPHVLQRRRFPRIDVFLSISLRLPDRPLEAIPAQLINVSLEGAACVLVEPVSPGAALTLNLSALGLHPPEAGAIVVRCTPTPSHLWVVGLKLQGLLTEQELYLGKYISRFISDQPQW